MMNLNGFWMILFLNIGYYFPQLLIISIGPEQKNKNKKICQSLFYIIVIVNFWVCLPNHIIQAFSLINQPERK